MTIEETKLRASQMNGQWTGRYNGTNSGGLIVNLDDLGSYFQGVAYLTDDNATFPTIGAVIRTTNKAAEFHFHTDVWPILRQTGNAASREEVKEFYPNVSVPTKAEVRGRWDSHSLTFAWQTDIGTSGSCELPRSKAADPSDLNPLKMGWEEFKVYVSKLAGRRHLFRGQEQPWRLRTAFHRAGRADLVRFVREDIQTLHRHLSARTRHIFNLARKSRRKWCIL